MVVESGWTSQNNTTPAGRTTYSENLRKRIVELHSRGVVPSAIAVSQNVTFGTVRSALNEAGIKIPSYLSWEDSAFGKVERCKTCGHDVERINDPPSRPNSR